MTLVQTPSSLALIQELIQSLQDPDAASRFTAAQELGQHGEESSPAVGALLRKALHDPDVTVRLQAAMALYKIGHRADSVIPLLIRALHDPDEARCWVAADCLGEIGPEAHQAIPALRLALKREFKNSIIRKGVEIALEKISGVPADE